MAEFIDFSQTRRIVLLIDLNPLLHLQNPKPYLSTILTASRILLNDPSLPSPLFAFKLFFSSLSPLLSSSKLHQHPLLPKPSLSLSFDDRPNTFISLSQILNSLHTLCDESEAASPPRAYHTASSLRQIVHDYAWEHQIDDPLGTPNPVPIVRSNLVILLSPVCKSLKCLSEYMICEMDDESLKNIDAFSKKFHGVFGSVNNAFVSRDIHFSWVDVKYESECSETKLEVDESELRLGYFENGIRSLGWGYCSTESIILGSALVPFGLIYPMIGVSSRFLNHKDVCKRIHVQLSLEILDVNGKPLECKCCDLDLIDLKFLPRNRCNDVFHAWEIINSQSGGDDQGKTFWGQFGNGITKLQIKAVQRSDEGMRLEGHLSEIILVSVVSGIDGKVQKESSGDLFADKVLEMLMMEMGGCLQRESKPIWQILLSFLYREGYWALVSISNNNGDSCMGILKPFTVHSGLLCVTDKIMAHDIGGMTLDKSIMKTDKEICKSNAEMNHSNGFIDSQSGNSPSKNNVEVGVIKRKKNKRNLHLYQDLTWSSFRKAAFEHSKMDLEEIYFTKELNSSKKLKFLKCWMKQIKKSFCCSLTIPDGSNLQQDVLKETEERLTESHQDSQQSVSSSASAGEDSQTGASRIQDGVALTFCSETSEVFFGNLSQKIHDGLESKAIDLAALAERLVNSSIHWLYQKHGMDTPSESQTLAVNPDDTCASTIAAELIRLLLKEPKDLSVKHKNNDPSFQSSDPRSTGFASDDIVRKYELQILFRMEILQSEVAVSMEESARQKFVKQICLLLENIQCHMEGGFFGDWSLDSYVGRTIKSRYCNSLGDVVNKIYTKMDLLLFSDELPNPLFNSEDSNQSWRDKQENIREPASAEEESFHSLEKNIKNKGEEHARRLIEARERRERAQRFASFTSWKPDLQRVWAPKQQVKSDSFPKLSKRKNRRRRRTSLVDDMVCETPMTGKKRSCLRGGGSSSSSFPDQDSGINSVSKALFQDDK